jgi:nucleotide-binding universal stress UspA family protein
VIWASAPEVARVDDELLADLVRYVTAPRGRSAQAAAARGRCGERVIERNPVDVLVQRSHELDRLVIGSRGYGPLRAVLLECVSGRVIGDGQEVATTSRASARTGSPPKIQAPAATVTASGRNQAA